MKVKSVLVTINCIRNRKLQERKHLGKKSQNTYMVPCLFPWSMRSMDQLPLTSVTLNQTC